MNTQATFDKLAKMRMHAFAGALSQQLSGRDHDQLSFEDRIAMLVDKEYAQREQRSLTRRLALARLRDRSACIEDIDYRAKRGLDRSVISRLSSCQWIRHHEGLAITGKTGTGKTYIACALAEKACRQGLSVLYRRVPRLLHDIVISRADGSYARLMARLAKADLVLLDDWGIAVLADQERREILELVEARHGNRSTAVISQLPVPQWHSYIGEPTIADAVLDRLIHDAHRIELDGESMRKRRSRLHQEAASD